MKTKMMKLKLFSRGAVLALSLGLPALAQAQPYSDGPSPHPYYRHHDDRRYHHYRTCGADRRRRGNNGTAIGAVSGGVLGSALGGGHLGNILLGAGAGAVAGHEIGRHTTRC